MDVLIIAGISKSSGSQYGVGQQVVLDGRVMSYTNLQKTFGVNSPNNASNYNTPYLAGIYLYNYLSRRGINCGLVNFLDIEIESFIKFIKQSPKVIALSSTFLTNVQLVKKVTQLIRRYAPDIKIILGGPLVYNSYLLYQLRNSDYDTDSCRRDYFFLNTEEFYHQDIDLFVIEEQGEETLRQIVWAIKNCRDYKEIPNLAYYQNNRLHFTARKAEHNDFAEDLVHWDEVPEEFVYPIFPMRGSRGCPYRCRYCNFSPNRIFQLKSPEILGQEIAALVKTGRAKMIRFTDDNLFLTRKQVEQYCRKIIEVGKGIRWSSFIRANSISKENVKLISDSGCIATMIGMESGNKNILKEMNKEDTPEHYLEAIALLNAQGISTQLSFLIGFPGETPQTIEDTVSLINQFPYQGPALNEVSIFPFGLAPLSPIYSPEYREKYHLSGYMMDWSHGTMNSEEAKKYAGELFGRLRHVHGHYGIEELILLNITKLKKLAELRSQIRRAEMTRNSIQTNEPLWKELKEVVLSD